MDVSLAMFKADGTRRDFPIKSQRVIVGRQNDCDLRIPLSSVSRQHFEVRLNGSSLLLRDLGSSNGTYHNDKRVEEASLMPGDRIMVGPVVFTVVIDGHPEEIKPVRTMIGGEGTAVTPTPSALMEEGDGDASSAVIDIEETLKQDVSGLDDSDEMEVDPLSSFNAVDDEEPLTRLEDLEIELLPDEED